jgi:glycosyltransferase involved in cell wall biosynthesis
MNIAITAEHANIDQLTGVEHYTRELIHALARVDDRNQYTLYLRTPPGTWCSNLPSNFNIRVVAARMAWTQLHVSWEIFKSMPDALLVTSFSMPFIHPRNSVVTIHDLAWRLFPETVELKDRVWLLLTHRFAAASAKRLIAVSQQTRHDLMELMKVKSQKIEVIHHGFALVPADAGTPSPLMPTTSSRKNSAVGIDGPFVLCLGTLQPRKNLVRMIDAFLALKQRTGLPHTLVLAGRAGWMCNDVLEKVRVSPDVLHLGYVPDRLSLLRAADLLVQPAVYEGFGLSLLDAFSQGVPVACSNVSSLPEIAGDAAELFDPYSTESISAAMIHVLTNPERAEELRRLGNRRLQSFNWDDCAKRTLAVIEAT